MLETIRIIKYSLFAASRLNGKLHRTRQRI